MNPPDSSAACSPGTPCITCSDQGLVMRVIAARGDGMAVCTGEDEHVEEIEISLLGAVSPGDLVLVHAGVALTRLDDGKGAR